MEPKWFNVNEDAQIWSGHADNHKQFKMSAPAAILAIDEYKGSYQFEEAKAVASDGTQFTLSMLPDPGYPQLWIRIADVTTSPFEDEDDVADELDPPDDEEPGDEPDIGSAAELGRAIWTIRAQGGGVVFPAGE